MYRSIEYRCTGYILYIHLYTLYIHFYMTYLLISDALQNMRLTSIVFGAVHSDRTVVDMLHKLFGS